MTKQRYHSKQIQKNNFGFLEVEKEEIEKEILNLDANKASQNSEFPFLFLPNLSKIFEKCFIKQISHPFDNTFSKYQCGFRKGFSTQHCLFAMLEKWKRFPNSDKAFGTLLTDLSKTFDCLDHQLLIAKLNTSGFSLTANLFRIICQIGYRGPK